MRTALLFVQGIQGRLRTLTTDSFDQNRDDQRLGAGAFLLDLKLPQAISF